MKHQNTTPKKKIRYAVVGLGDIAQAAVLPGFTNAGVNSELAALIWDDPKKLKQLSKYYRVPDTCGYDDYDALLRSDKVDAVYLALPNPSLRIYQCHRNGSDRRWSHRGADAEVAAILT